MMAFDSGVRREEMMRTQVKHIDFNPITVTIDDELREVLVIEVQSKGEKFTGEKKRVYAGTQRFIAALRKRRDEWQNNPHADVFGTANWFRQQDFHNAWHHLFKIAGLDFGRNKGLVWHAASRVLLEDGREHGDPVVAQVAVRACWQKLSRSADVHRMRMAPRDDDRQPRGGCTDVARPPYREGGEVSDRLPQLAIPLRRGAQA